MTTRTVSIKDFRDNLTKYLREGQKRNIHFVVMRHGEPVASVAPMTKKAMALEELLQEVKQAREDLKQGKFYTLDEIEKMVGL